MVSDLNRILDENSAVNADGDVVPLADFPEIDVTPEEIQGDLARISAEAAKRVGGPAVGSANQEAATQTEEPEEATADAQESAEDASETPVEHKPLTEAEKWDLDYERLDKTAPSRDAIIRQIGERPPEDAA